MLKFIQENYGVTESIAIRMEKFTDFCERFDFINNASVWCKKGTRVYFDVKSQNRFYPVDCCAKQYYNAEQNTIVFNQYKAMRRNDFYPNDILRFQRGMFSGAKTRENLKDFCRRFLDESGDW
jgi:hypothetical protein